ncbi:GTPase ObgE [bacterium]|nr:GTPase ObgE [candidate division CSSED10-310 bacterium]
MSSFVDQASIEIHSGKGGAGCVSFRREKYIPRGGPDGGNGGRGGDVIFIVSPQHRTLLDFKYQKSFSAGNGKPGAKSNCHGKDGHDAHIPVPPGTMIISEETGEILADLTEPGQRIVLAVGGRGGMGNSHFATATHQVPRFAQPGEPGQSLAVRLELKLIADVGLVGFPNAGKSTFISVISNARPKIADYPFTTLTPNLGVVRRGSGREFIVADIPGIIEGSHEGKGLGDRFLRHIERTALILLLVDSSPIAEPKPEHAVRMLIHELKKYKESLELRVSAVIATKTDTIPDDDTAQVAALQSEAENRNLAFFDISSVARVHIDDVLDFIEKTLVEKRRQETAD